MSLSHHLAAVWFADVVGYTRLSEENEGEAVRLVHGFQRIAREVVARHGGRVVKFLGDGALAEFPSTDMAVRSAEELLRAFASTAKSEGLASDALRIGVHVGDVVATEDGDLYGDGVNVASRIQAAGDPGEVWVSEDVRRQLRQRPEFRFESRGERELKGLSRPLVMHAVQVLDAATWTPPEAGPQLTAPPTVAGKRNGAAAAGAERTETTGRWHRRRAVPLLGAGILIAAIGASTWFLGRGTDAAGSETVLAVLPFENLSGDEETEPFVLGVHDDLLTHLSSLGTFKVISRTTVMGYEGSTKSVPEIAKELGATTVLEGGVQRSGDRIRMNVQLIDARTDEHVWAERFDRTLTAGDVFAIQAEIAEEIAGALAIALTPEQKADLARAPTEDLEALDLYYQGLEHYRSRGGFGYESARRAESTLAAAVEADPRFAAAWAALAQARAWQVRNGVSTDTTGAREALDRAVALAPDTRETLVAEGVYLYYAQADFAGADDRFQEALSRWPEDAELLGWRALVVRRLGRWEEALELGERAVAIDPRNPSLLSYLGETYDNLRRFDDAERAWDRVVTLSPRDGSARYWKTLLLLEGKGDPERARRFLDASADVMGPAGTAVFAAMVSFFERDYEAGIADLEGKPVESDAPPVAPYLLAILSRWAGREAESRMWADSLYRTADRQFAELESGLDPFVQRAEDVAYRGIAHALAGRRADALRDARLVLELLPVSRDAVDAPRVHVLVVKCYILAGDEDAAFRLLDALAFIPAPMHPADLRRNPFYDSLRDDPRYPPLLAKLESAERSGTGTR
ncbi:MAG TPA: adenylate/guanylate cyclase domain-containing protein [Gemmatimonadota bacterium]|nr:adenylate/guanylate cyclase domain-containing protein [Gemmatimonadota bacterium]